MAHALLEIAVRHIRALAEEYSLAGAADGELLARFADQRDEAAFAVLLRRHGPMVLGVCRRVLKSYHDAEDVFQAAFLLLARKAGSVRKRASVGCWLHGVAHRLAVKMKAQAECRRSHEARAEAMRQTEATGRAPRHLEDLLDEALRRLPEHYRTALVLCHLEGRTHEEAARQLGCPLATLRSRLARGRKRLGAELMRRGLVLAGGIEAVALTACKADAALPAFLVGTTLKAVIPFAAGGTVAGAVPAALAEAGLKAMAMMKIKIVILLIAALGLVAGAGAIACQAFAAKPAPEKPPATKPPAEPERKDETQVRLDDYGDPLPDGAVRRVGTLRFRQGGGEFDTLLVTPDGKTLVSSTDRGDRTICSWNLATGKLLHSFPGSYDFGQIALSPDGTTLAAPLQYDNAIVLSDLASGKELRRLTYQAFCPCSCAFSPDGKTLVSGSEGDCIDFWNLTTGRRTQQCKAPNRVTLLAFTLDGKTVASGDYLDGAILLWDATTGKEIRRLKRPGVEWALAFSPDGAFLTCAGGDSDKEKKNVIPLWDVKTGKLVHEMPADYARSVAFSPDGKTLASAEFGDDTGAIVLRDVSSGKRLRSMEDSPERVVFSADGKTIIAGDGGGVIRLWGVETGKEKTPAKGRLWIISATATTDGRMLAFYDGKVVRLWDLIEGREVGVLPTECRGETGLSFSRDGKMLATVDGIDTVSLWDVSSRKLLRRIERDKNGRTWLETAALAPDGKTLATGHYDAAVLLWDTSTGKKLGRLTIQTPGEEAKKPNVRVFLQAIAFSPNGEKLAASGTTPGTAGSRVRFWDITPNGGEPRLLWEIEAPAEGNRAPSGSPWLDRIEPHVVFSHDGRMLAMNRYQKTIPLWEATTGKQRLLLSGHTESTCCVAFAPDGRTLASSGYDDTIRLWDMETGEELRTLTGHRGKANSLAFSADGKTLVSTGDDTTMLFWDVAEITQRPKPKVVALSPEECKSLWTDLAGADAAKAYKAIRAFSAAPGQTVSFFGERLRPARSAGKEEVNRLIADLDSDDFQIREKAMSELEELGDTTKLALQKVIDGQPSAEVRSRVNRLLEKLATPAPELLRNLRALEALEAVGGPEARQVVDKIANGAAEAQLTRDAKAALARLDVSRKR